MALAGRVLSVNQARHERLVRIGIPEHKLAVVRNGPSLARFDPGAYPRRTFMADGVLRLYAEDKLSAVTDSTLPVPLQTYLDRNGVVDARVLARSHGGCHHQLAGVGMAWDPSWR